jgi:hypothetical protein
MPPYIMNVDPEWLNTFSPTKAVVKELTTDDDNSPGMQALGEEPDAWFADSNIAVFVSTAVIRRSHMVAMRLQTCAADHQEYVKRQQGWIDAGLGLHPECDRPVAFDLKS